MSDTRKMIPVSLKTHAKLTREVGRAMVKGKGRRFTFDEIISNFLEGKHPKCPTCSGYHCPCYPCTEPKN